MGEQQDRPTYKVLSTRTIVWFGVVLVVVGAGVAAALLLAYGTGTEADKARLDAIKTAGTIVVGTGGAAALWLAARRQQAAEIALRQKDIDQAHQEQDAAERRVTELYTKAVEQLGSEKAPVRLGGMYALERLAQNVPDQRQAIVNVLCAYLRMPFQLPVTPDLVSSVTTVANPLIVPQQLDKQTIVKQVNSTVTHAENEYRTQEREVRLTAQYIIAGHLHPGNDANSPLNTFWENIDVNLAGATLIAFNLRGCRVRKARFHDAKFESYAEFTGVTFEGYAGFGGAAFNGYAWFGGTTFKQGAEFAQATFKNAAVLAGFNRVTFEGYAGFNGATFNGHALFEEATFKGDARFESATFAKDAEFSEATFMRGAEFGKAAFGGAVKFDRSLIRLDISPEPNRNWPDAFSVASLSSSQQNTALEVRGGTWGYLVPISDGDQSDKGV